MEAWRSFLEANIVYLHKLPTALIVLAVSYVVIQLAKNVVVRTTTLAKVDRAAQTMLKSVVSFFGWLLALAAVLNVMELSELSLALGGSIALIAMAVATGLNNVAQDLLAGIFLLSDREFATGSWVKAAGVEGRLVELTIRKTRIRDREGNLHTIPNRTVDGGTYVVVPEELVEESQTQAGA